MRVRFRPEARLDILEARAWYEERAAGLGAEFSRAIDFTVAGIIRFPRVFPEVHGEVRKAVVRRFPYSLLHVIEGDEVVILGCLHHRGVARSNLTRLFA